MQGSSTKSELQGWIGSNIKVVVDACGYPSGSLRCQTYFEVDKSKTILNWKTSGNDCRK